MLNGSLLTEILVEFLSRNRKLQAHHSGHWLNIAHLRSSHRPMPSSYDTLQAPLESRKQHKPQDLQTEREHRH